MDKRYQVFVSSTFADLKDERQKVIQTLMEMDCIPSGMEIFPAADEEQWEFIKKVIDDCDYYLLIIGGRYGSIADDGISYTQKEYEYAIQSGIKVIALLHGKPGDIPTSKSESNPQFIDKLQKFRETVSSGRLVKFWQNADELPGLVSLSLTKTIKTYPAIGWIRADRIAGADLLAELNEIHKENAQLRQALKDAGDRGSPIVVSDIAGIEERFEVLGGYLTPAGPKDWALEVSWKHIFSVVAPYLMNRTGEMQVKRVLAKSLSEECKVEGGSIEINDQIFQTIKIQLIGLELVLVEPAVGDSVWSLTRKGERLLFDLRTIRAAVTS